MLLKGLSDEAFPQWLASIICCVPFRKPQEDERGDHHLEVPQNIVEICYDQPHLITPPRPEPQHQRSGSRSSILASQLMARSWSLASGASQTGRVMMKRMTGESRRPTISGPSSFRHLVEEEHITRHGGFRPLELSIYYPHNKLSPLPDFSSPNHGSVLATRTVSVQSDPSSEFRIARKPLKPSVDLSLVDMNEFRIVDTRSFPSTFGADGLVQPLRPRPSLPVSFNAPYTAASLNSKKLPKPPSTLRACSYTGPMCQVTRRDSDPFLSNVKKERAVSGQTLSGSPDPNMFRTGASDATNIDHVSAPPRPRSPRTSIMARPHPLKPLPPLPTGSEIPHRQTSLRPSTTGCDSYGASSQPPAWLLLPTEQDINNNQATDPTSHFSPTNLPDPPARRPSTASTLYTGSTHSTFSYPPTPPTVSPQSSPGRPTPIRQRTFGFIEAKSHFETINEVHVDRAWLADRAAAAAAATTLDHRFAAKEAVGVAV